MKNFATSAAIGALLPMLFATAIQADQPNPQNGLQNTFQGQFRPATAEYRVTITNVTRGQVFSPPVLAIHNRNVAIFEAGQPALDELAIVAEDGDTVPLVDLLSTLPDVFRAQAASAPVLPGESAEYTVFARPGFLRLSSVGMLVNTNDAFFAVDSVSLPRRRGSSETVYAMAYDAGSEANNEECAFIPGPACPPGSGNARALDGAEGYVYISNGVHGIADLAADAYDWRNPVARVNIERVR